MTRVSPLFGALEQLARSGALEPAALGELFGGKSAPPAPAIPAPPPVVPLPDMQDPAILAAQRRSLQAAAAGTGRASTILRAQDDYSTSKTGVA